MLEENKALREILKQLSSTPESKKTAQSKDVQKKDEGLREKKLHNDLKETEIELKKEICRWVKRVVSVYLVFVAVMLLIVAFYSPAGLSEQVIIVLLTTTTINILGLPYMIIRSLFPPEKK